jgi:hypothetical protein
VSNAGGNGLRKAKKSRNSVRAENAEVGFGTPISLKFDNLPQNVQIAMQAMFFQKKSKLPKIDWWDRGLGRINRLLRKLARNVAH